LLLSGVFPAAAEIYSSSWLQPVPALVRVCWHVMPGVLLAPSMVLASCQQQQCSFSLSISPAGIRSSCWCWLCYCHTRAWDPSFKYEHCSPGTSLARPSCQDRIALLEVQRRSV